MTSCCQPHPMPWNGATDAIVRCKGVSTACGRKSRSVRVWHWICGVKRTPKAVNKPLPYFIVHELDKPGNSATVSTVCHQRNDVERYSRSKLSGKIYPQPTGTRPLVRLLRR